MGQGEGLLIYINKGEGEAQASVPRDQESTEAVLQYVFEPQGASV